MNIGLAVGAAIGCALCNSAAAILQKVSSDKVTTIRTYDTRVFVGLIKQLPYVAGILLDLFAGLLTLVAVNRLPLFVVEAVIASCVVVTALMEQAFLKRKLRPQTYYAAIIVLTGLICIGAAAHGEKTAAVSTTLRNAILIAPLALGLIGTIAVRIKHKGSTALLAALSGCAFGGVSIIGRVLVYPSPIWMLVKNPLLYALVAYGLLGIFFFTAALQRTLATIVNGVMTSVQTVVPLLIGIVLLGDTARNGLWASLWIGCFLVTAGAAYIASTDQ